MSKINRFVINNTAATLSVLFDKVEQERSKAVDLSFEYLRVFSPTKDKGQPIGSMPKVYHKKQVQLVKIESVGKHGYRFIFDDNHSDIYSLDYLQVLAAEQQQRWQDYLQSANTAINSREATIEIKELK